MSKTKKPSVRWDRNAGIMHIEAPGAIINVQVGLSTNGSDEVTRVEVLADGDRYAGEPEWWIEGKKGNATLATRIIRRDRA